jgi:hypothetical protein
MRIKANKSGIVRINLSTPFVVRSRCKKCGEHPSIYYCMGGPTMWHNPRQSQNEFAYIRKHTNRLCSDYYLMEPPINYNMLMQYFNFKVYFNSYRPRLHRSCTNNKLFFFDIVEYLSCKCGGATWAFNNKYNVVKPGTSLRKARNNFPFQFKS